MRPTDITAATSVGDPQLSPDGRHIAYVVQRVDEAANTYTSQIWVAATDGTGRPRALTAGEHRDSQPRWSPDGTQIAFTSSRAKDPAGKTKSTLHLLPFEVPGETVLLAQGDEGFGDPVFSPDGSMLAVIHRVRGEHYASDEIGRRPARKIEHLQSRINGAGYVYDRPSHVHVVPTDGSAPLRDITPGPFEFQSAAWLADGDRLAAMFNPWSDNYTYDIGIIDAAGPADGDVEPHFLTDATGWYGAPSLTPDGMIAVIGADNPNTIPKNAHIGVLDPAATEPATPDWKTAAVDRTWAPMMTPTRPTPQADGSMLGAIENRGNVELCRVQLDTGEVTTILGGDRTITGWSAGTHDDSEVVAFTATSATEPAELFVLIDGTERQLTNHGHAFTSAIEPQPAEHFLAGEADVDAWIITPHDFDPDQSYPMLLNIHGGPFTQYGNFLFDEVQMQARAGYVVVYANPRGGSGRDTAWGQAICGPNHPEVGGTGWGSVDFDDVMAVVDTALERYRFIDAYRLGVLGGSYGGYLTSWTVTHTNRFAAACSERAVNNMVSLEHSSDIAGFFAGAMGTTWLEEPDLYVKMSPITYVEDLDTPLLIMHSEDDLRCPQDQAWQMFHACKALGKPDVEFWLFPGENHELSRSGSPSHRVQRAEVILDFFDRYLKPPADESGNEASGD